MYPNSQKIRINSKEEFKIQRNRLVFFSLFICTLIALSATATKADISPDSLTVAIRPGETVIRVVTVTTPVGPSIGLLELRKGDSLCGLRLGSWDPLSYANVGGGDSRDFTLTFTAPNEMPCGTGACNYPLEALCDGDVCGSMNLIQIFLCADGDVPLFSDALAILPISTCFTVFIVRRRRSNEN
jgi:hypothetical protein